MKSRLMDDHLSLYVEAPEYMPVRASVRGEQRGGHVIGWRGQRAFLRWKTSMSEHIGWLPSADVERR